MAANDQEAIDRTALQLLKLSEPWKVVAMYGEMGSGKTTLVKALCKHLGVSMVVSSPTFTIINQYSDQQGTPVYHMDLYRLENPHDALQLGLDEYFSRECWCFIEWPEKIPGFLPQNCVSLSIELDPDHLDRKLTLVLP